MKLKTWSSFKIDRILDQTKIAKTEMILHPKALSFGILAASLAIVVVLSAIGVGGGIQEAEARIIKTSS